MHLRNSEKDDDQFKTLNSKYEVGDLYLASLELVKRAKDVVLGV